MNRTRAADAVGRGQRRRAGAGGPVQAAPEAGLARGLRPERATWRRSSSARADALVVTFSARRATPRQGVPAARGRRRQDGWQTPEVPPRPSRPGRRRAAALAPRSRTWRWPRAAPSASRRSRSRGRRRAADGGAAAGGSDRRVRTVDGERPRRAGRPGPLEVPATGGSPTPRPELRELRRSASERVYIGEPIDLKVTNADVTDVIRTFAQISGLNVLVQPGVQRRRDRGAGERPLGPGAGADPQDQRPGLRARRQRDAHRPGRGPARRRPRKSSSSRRPRRCRSRCRRSTAGSATPTPARSPAAPAQRPGRPAVAARQRDRRRPDQQPDHQGAAGLHGHGHVGDRPARLARAAGHDRGADHRDDQALHPRVRHRLGLRRDLRAPPTATPPAWSSRTTARSPAASTCRAAATAGTLGFRLGNVLNTFTLDVALQAAESEGLINDPVRAQGGHAQQPAGLDPERPADPHPDDRQQHRDRAVRVRDPAARR